MARVLILSILQEEESLIDRIMAIINNPHDGQEFRSGKGASVISIGKLQISNKGMALSKDQIYNCIWNGEYSAGVFPSKKNCDKVIPNAL